MVEWLCMQKYKAQATSLEVLDSNFSSAMNSMVALDNVISLSLSAYLDEGIIIQPTRINRIVNVKSMEPLFIYSLYLAPT